MLSPLFFLFYIFYSTYNFLKKTPSILGLSGIRQGTNIIKKRLSGTEQCVMKVVLANQTNNMLFSLPDCPNELSQDKACTLTLKSGIGILWWEASHAIPHYRKVFTAAPAIKKEFIYENTNI